MTIEPIPLPPMRCHWPGACERGIVHPGPCAQEGGMAPGGLELPAEALWREHIGIGPYEDVYRDWNENVLKVPAHPAVDEA